MCSFGVRLSVLLCVRSELVNQTSLKWELNANSSKKVKDTDFKFDKHVPRDSLFVVLLVVVQMFFIVRRSS